jgi:hypothetical protein
MTHEERDKAITWSEVLRSALVDLEGDLLLMNDEVCEIQWEQVQADMVTLTARMNATGVQHNDR